MRGRVLGLLFLLVGSAWAQFDANKTVRVVRVRITFSDGRCEAGIQVVLQGKSGAAALATADNQCQAEFFDVPVDEYHVGISGQSVIDNEAGTIRVVSFGSGEYEVRVRRASNLEQNRGGLGNVFISAADLAIPACARKSFDQAGQLIGKQEFTKAIGKLNQAIAIYPSYAAAYNNLGVIYARLGDRARESEALQKAISINDHYAPAYVNLGKMEIAAGDFPSAENTFTKVSADSTDPAVFFLLAYSQILNKHFGEALATSRKAHTLPVPHAFAHQMAALAYEQMRDTADAISELELFLKEEPSGAQAENARVELTALRERSQSLREQTASSQAPRH